MMSYQPQLHLTIIRSTKLDEFFAQYNSEWCYSFIKQVFAPWGVSTRSDVGTYLWLGDYGRNITQVHTDCPNALIGTSLCCFLEQKTENEVIYKFTKYNNLKAFI